MGHSQFAELIGARGPNTQVNAACASTTQAVALAEDWIRAGRCRRVIVIAADDATSDTMLGVDRRRLPRVGRRRDRRGRRGRRAAVRPAAPRDDPRHGRGGAGGRARRRRARARHRADLRGARRGDGEQRVPRHAPRRRPHRRRDGGAGRARPNGAGASAASRSRRQLVFVSHETYTPARGGSAAAEVDALRAVFGADADSVVVANTKGFTGHPMGVGHRGRRGGEGAGDGHRPAGRRTTARSTPSSARSTCRRAARTRCGTRCVWRPGSVRRSAMTLLRWVPSPDGAAARGRRARLRVPDRRPRPRGRRGWPRHRRRRARARGGPPRGCGSSTGDRAAEACGAARRTRRSVPLPARRRCRAHSTTAPRAHRGRAAPAAAPRHRAGDPVRGRRCSTLVAAKHRLPARHARRSTSTSKPTSASTP